MRSGISVTIMAIMVSVVAACAARVHPTETAASPPMARPDRVVVAYFSILPEQVRLNQGIAARLARDAGDTPVSAEKLRIAQATQATLAEKLTDRLRAYGLPAVLATTDPIAGSSLLVEGQIVSIDQGNRARRVLIGLGAGKSSVAADAQIYYASGTGATRFLSAFEGQADSGRMPGAAETMGAGAAVGVGTVATSAAVSGTLHGGAELRRTSDTAEAGRLADGLARQIGQFAVSQGWIPPEALRRF